jgi:hypothetical protein
MRERVAIGRQKFTEATSLADEAVRLAGCQGDAPLVAEAAYGAAFVHLWTGDTAALDQATAACEGAARLARDPLRILKVRLIRAERLRRAARSREAVQLLAPLTRLASTRLPRIIGWRWALAQKMLAAPDGEQDVPARLAEASGLPALTLFGPQMMGACAGAIDAALAVLRTCQTADEEETTLASVCQTLRRRLDASPVAWFASQDATCTLIAGAGIRPDSVSATRASAGMPVVPQRFDGRIEAAVPVRYGGRLVGALAAGWARTPPDTSTVMPVLVMTAEIAAPVVAAIAARRPAVPPEHSDALLGVSAAIAAVRRAADRAAGAPFAVLVEGETGSGKELVSCPGRN